MTRQQSAWIGLGFGVAALVGAYLYLSGADDLDGIEDDDEAAAAREAEREREVEERWDDVAEESRDLVPRMIEGIELGMGLLQAQQRRPGIERNGVAQNPDEPNMRFFEERLPNGARVVYGFERESQRLQRIQVLSMLPSPEAIGPHLQAMNDQYGTPTGIWDCPNTGGVHTRRFTWRHGQTTVSDVFLVYGGRVSVTLYIAPTGIIHRSLRMAGCRAVRDAEEASTFPVTSPEQMMGESGSAPPR